MKKLTLALAVVFAVSTVSAFAGDKLTDKEKKEKKEAAMMKMAPGKSCSKKCNDKDKDEKKADKKD